MHDSHVLSDLTVYPDWHFRQVIYWAYKLSKDEKQSRQLVMPAWSHEVHVPGFAAVAEAIPLLYCPSAH